MNPRRWLMLACLLALTLGALTGQDAPAPGSVEREAETPPATPGTTPGTPVNPTALMPGGANVAVIDIQGMIYGFTYESLQRRIDRALANGADVIVIELNTNGGFVPPALEISKYLKDSQRVPVPTIAWVNNKAYSAGILIAAACDQIVMSGSSATGDCAPIMPGMNLSPTERAKVFSPIASEFRDSAQRNGYDYSTFHAMCELGVELYLIEHKETAQRRVVNQVDDALMVQGRDPNAPSAFGALFGRGSASVNPDQIEPVKRLAATDADVGQWKPVEQLPSGSYAPKGLIHANNLFTPNQTLAQDIGLSKATVSSLTELEQYLGAAKVTRVSQTWSEDLAAFLTNFWVRGILLAIALIAGMIELWSPGFGVPGTIALVALVVLLGAPFIIGLSAFWHVLLFILGFVLLIIEIAFTPGFGLLGITGICCMFIGLVFQILPASSGGGFGLPSGSQWNLILGSALWLLLGLASGIVGFVFFTRHFGQIPVFNRLILANEPADSRNTPLGPPASAGGSEPAHTPHISGDEALGFGAIRVGDTGRVSSTGLHPNGRAEINGQLVDVVSLGSWIDPGQRIAVVEVHGNRIVVDAM